MTDTVLRTNFTERNILSLPDPIKFCSKLGLVPLLYSTDPVFISRVEKSNNTVEILCDFPQTFQANFGTICQNRPQLPLPYHSNNFLSFIRQSNCKGYIIYYKGPAQYARNVILMRRSQHGYDVTQELSHKCNLSVTDRTSCF